MQKALLSHYGRTGRHCIPTSTTTVPIISASWKRPTTTTTAISSSSSSSSLKSFSTSVSSSLPTPSQQYKQLISQRKVNSDPNQLRVLEKLDNLYHKLLGYDLSKAQAILKQHQQQNQQQDGGISSWFGFMSNKSKKSDNDGSGVVVNGGHPAELPKSLYMYGGVGCGKTMLMDMFYNCAPTNQKLRIHFNSFMVNFHSRMHQLRSQEPGVDHIPAVVQEIIQKHWLLCFDEFQVTDIADAMILKRVFEDLLNNGAVVVATSNRPPDDLYENGLNRARFIPFIQFLKEKCEVHNMNSESDYRLTGQQSARTVYHVYNNETERLQVNEKVNELFKQLTTGNQIESKIITAMGAKMIIPESARSVAKFSFDDICRKAYGAAQFIELSKTYHTVVLTDVPKMDIFSSGDVMRRFILLIDELYQHNVKLICTAEAAPHHLLLYPDGKTKKDFLNQENVFAFDRTISRLIEMQSREYLMKGHVEPSKTTDDQQQHHQQHQIHSHHSHQPQYTQPQAS